MDEEDKITHNAVNELITLRDKADEELAESEREASALAADMQETSDERQDRTYAAMQVCNVTVYKYKLHAIPKVHWCRRGVRVTWCR